MLSLIDISLVFSCWTTTLDVLQQILANHNMAFVRIDGSQSLDERAMKMDRFQSDPTLHIMLLSTGCGSTGYAPTKLIVYPTTDCNQFKPHRSILRPPRRTPMEPHGRSASGSTHRST